MKDVNSELDRQIEGVALLQDPVRRAVYRFVAGQDEAVSRDQAAEAAGVRRAAAAFHLDRLVEEGLLDVEWKRLSGRTGPGAGRPSKLYRRSDRELDVSVPQRQYDIAGHLLAGAIQDAESGPLSVTKALGRRAREYGAGLAAEVRARAGSKSTKKARRAATLDVLAEHGYEPSEQKRRVILRNCPFHALSRDHTELVCGMNLELMQGMVDGLDDGGIEARLDPSPGRCCVTLDPA